MRTSVLVSVFAAYVALLSARVGGASFQKEGKEKPPPDFARDVLPIIEDNCLRCHSAAAQKGGLILDTHEDIMTGGENGEVLVAGDSAKSRLVQMIRDQGENCLLYTSPSPRDGLLSRMPSSA